METIVRNVCDLPQNERSTLEGLVGHDLGENQTLVIQVVSAPAPAALPEWCDVYDGLTEQQIALLEKSFQRHPERLSE